MAQVFLILFILSLSVILNTANQFRITKILMRKPLIKIIGILFYGLFYRALLASTFNVASIERFFNIALHNILKFDESLKTLFNLIVKPEFLDITATIIFVVSIMIVGYEKYSLENTDEHVVFNCDSSNSSSRLFKNSYSNTENLYLINMSLLD